MSQPEWMQKFKQIGLKTGEEEDGSGDAGAGGGGGGGGKVDSRFQKFEQKEKADSGTPPWMKELKKNKAKASNFNSSLNASGLGLGAEPANVVLLEDDEEDAAALFAMAGSIPAIHNDDQEEGGKEEDVQSGSGQDTTKPSQLSAEEEETAERFRKMLKMGMPEGAVVQKMAVEDVPAHIQSAVSAAQPAEEPAPAADENRKLPAEDEEIVERFKKMLKMGMPEGAVVQKMSVEGVSKELQDNVLKPDEDDKANEVDSGEPATGTELQHGISNDHDSVEEEIIVDEYSEEEELVEDEEVVEESVSSVLSGSEPEHTGTSGQPQSLLASPAQGSEASQPPANFQQKISDEEFGEPWVINRDRVMHDLASTRFEEVEVERDTGNVHYDEVYVDEHGNFVTFPQRPGEYTRGVQSQESVQPTLGYTGDIQNQEGIEVEEEVEYVDAPPVTQSQRLQDQQHTQSTTIEEQAPTQSAAPGRKPPPIYDPSCYDVENQRRLLKSGSTAFRSRMTCWAPLIFMLAVVAFVLLLLLLVIFADDDRVEQNATPAPTPTGLRPLQPTNTGAIDVAATTPMDPVTASCDFQDREQPHVTSQCACDGRITIIAEDVQQRYQSLLDPFLSSFLPDFDEPVDSCDPRNQALVWLSTGTNNGGEVDEVIRRERFVLAYFYFDQGGIGWSDRNGWTSEANVCQWDRILCDFQGRVSSIDLSSNRLIGELSPALALLEHLTFFSAAENRIEGTIPPELISSSTLRSLDLSFNFFFGEIPSFPEDSNLEIINFARNNLSLDIPTSIGNVESLSSLNLAQNSLNGNIPTQLFSLPLQELHLQSNQLTGTIPNSISGLSAIRTLTLGMNGFTGDIPGGIGELTSLERLLIDDVPGLEGRLPAVYGLQLTNLVEFVLRDTNVRGNIPDQFGMMTSLQTLDLGRNSLGRAIPRSLGQLTNLITLRLENNAFTGTIPTELGNVRSLMELNMRGNQLVGTIPSTLGQITSLGTLSLDGNFLDGRAPREVCALRERRLDEFTVDCPERLNDIVVVGVLCTIPSCCTECL